jgi:uncharacterized protein
VTAHGGFVEVFVIELHLADVHDLKGKRKEVSSIKAQLRTRLGAAVAETDHQDLWQRATLTAALTGGSLHRLRTAGDELERWVLGRCPEGATVSRLTASVAELAE